MEKKFKPVSNPSPVATIKDEGTLKESIRLGLGDRSKRDEWSEGAITSLLDTYETKWVLRNRGKLKGHDWEEVSHQVSSRLNSTTKPVKTATQCKNKIESMKKRYRLESAIGCGSKWPLFPRLDSLVRWRVPAVAPVIQIDGAPLLPPPSGTRSSNSKAANEVLPAAQGDHGEGRGKEPTKHCHREEESSTPSSKVKHGMKRTKKRKELREEGEGWEVLASIQWLTKVALMVEEASMNTILEVKKMRSQSDTRMGEIDLKRTEIIANTQLQIANLLAGNKYNG